MQKRLRFWRRYCQDIKDQLFIGLYDFIDGQDFDHEKIQGITVILDKRGYWSDVLLDREHVLTLVTGYDVKARHAINKRWLEFEREQSTQPLENIEQLPTLPAPRAGAVKGGLQLRQQDAMNDLIKARLANVAQNRRGGAWR